LALISEEKSWLSAALMCGTHFSKIHQCGRAKFVPNLEGLGAAHQQFKCPSLARAFGSDFGRKKLTARRTHVWYTLFKNPPAW
jgi:hypothetical protein